jgi:hypothetical protein
MADDNTDPPVAGDTSANPDSSGSPAKPAAAVYTKDDLTRIVAREVAKASAGRSELEQRLTAIEEEKRAAEEAKLSMAQRADLERKREREAAAAQIAALTARADGERAKRHDVLRAGRAASLASTIASQVANPGLLPHVERAITERLVVEVDEDGTERVVMRMGANGDNEPLESGFTKFRDEHLTPFLKVATGSGAQHGSGASGGRASIAHLSPTDKMLVGLSGKR